MTKKSPKFNNPYKLDNAKADEIRNLPNRLIVDRVTLEFRNWKASEDQKGKDPSIKSVKEAIKNLKDEVKTDPRYVEAKIALENIADELVSEEQARLEEELKNLNQPYNEDIKLFKSMFLLSMDELQERRRKGLVEIV